MADAAYTKLIKHHWYLTEETVVHALFTNHRSMTNNLKERMAGKLLETPKPTKFRRGIPLLQRRITESTSIEDLVGPESWFIFEALGIGCEWLRLPVTEWDSNPDFMEAAAFVKSVKVVNDAAERGIKLNSDYAAYITDKEQQRASLLQAVEEHRQMFPDFKKSTIARIIVSS